MLEYIPERRPTGGLRLAANKDASTREPIARGLMPSRLILSLGQHRGPPAEPVVAVGDRVGRGDLVGAANAPGSVAMHASASGIVTAVEPRPVPSATGVDEVICVVVDVDGEDRAGPGLAAWPDGRSERIERLRQAGIVGLGGAVFSTAAKVAGTRECRLLVVNGAECEPYISCDDMLMREAADEIVEGSLIMLDLLGAELGIVAIERDKPQALVALRRAVEASGSPALRVAELPTIYPAGGERQLIDVLTGEEVPSAKYPSHIGYACQNVGTAFAVQRLVAAREPLVSRIVTVTGNGVASPRNVDAPIGTPIAELIAFCGGYRGDVARLIHGGSMMGYALPSDELPLTKASNCIIAAAADEVRLDYTQWPCIRCGECQNVCPVRLQPQDLLIETRTSDFEALGALALRDCIECGCCDVVCPSHIPLTEIFRAAKRAQLEHERRAELSARAEQRYRRREERRRAESAEARSLQDSLVRELESTEDSKTAVIEAAVERARNRRARER